MMVAVLHQHRSRRFSVEDTRRTVRRVIRGERKQMQEISIVFTDGRFLRAMNRRYLGRDRMTDVIAFPLGSGADRTGEVYVSLDQARVQARAYGVPLQEEVRRLVIHGTLHLLGYSDDTRLQRVRMQTREDRYLVRSAKGRRRGASPSKSSSRNQR